MRCAERFLPILLLTIFLGACVDSGYEPEYEDAERVGGKADDGRDPLIDGTPTAVGLLRMLNDESTTFERLDDEARLDRRAAENLIAHRNGADGVFANGGGDDDLFDTIAEVDAVRQVGGATLQRLLDFALQQDFVPGNNQFLGEWDGVRFSVIEAERTLAFVNAATATELYDVLNDSRPRDGLLAGRPFASLQQVAAVYYVGKVMMQRLKAAAQPGPEGTLCMSNADCPDDLRCFGRPSEYQPGACRSITPLEGEGEECTTTEQCAYGLICSGVLAYGEGWCRPEWMGNTFTAGIIASIPGIVMTWPTEFIQTIWGLATVPEDISVTVRLEHTHPESLVIELVDPNGQRAMLWNGPAMSGAPFTPDMIPGPGISRDDRVNGDWALSVQNVGGLGEGTLRGWDLHLTSRFD